MIINIYVFVEELCIPRCLDTYFLYVTIYYLGLYPLLKCTAIVLRHPVCTCTHVCHM